ncbi:hypothetical protein ACJMK2_023266 [Sinanodonta woodiana]|uniref:Uncharacterized protein n=1 Tax=Sinanodonta woodiana TaxID=1069815 RepID=A0ABD3T495_SINWO
MKHNNSTKAKQFDKDMTREKRATSSKIIVSLARVSKSEILDSLTEYCSEILRHQLKNFPLNSTEAGHPILTEEVEPALKGLKKRKSDGTLANYGDMDTCHAQITCQRQ